MQIAKPSSTSTDSLPQSWVEKMFDKMLLDYGKKFVDQWAGADPDKLIAHWAREMASYTGPEIKRGLTAMEGRDWPPSLPEFKKMCRPPVDDMKAYYEAVEGVTARERGELGIWSHPAIFWAASRMTFDLREQTYSHNKTRWEKALADEMEKGEWPAIPAPMLALPEPGKGKLAKEEALRRLRELQADGLIKQPDSRINHLGWAHKILKRHENRDQSLPSVSLRFAREALGIK